MSGIQVKLNTRFASGVPVLADHGFIDTFNRENGQLTALPDGRAYSTTSWSGAASMRIADGGAVPNTDASGLAAVTVEAHTDSGVLEARFSQLSSDGHARIVAGAGQYGPANAFNVIMVGVSQSGNTATVTVIQRLIGDTATVATGEFSGNATGRAVRVDRNRSTVSVSIDGVHVIPATTLTGDWTGATAWGLYSAGSTANPYRVQELRFLPA